ncbi:peptidoglycan L-alanyl-D-glutamate endopeptidase CwlK [Sporosarcina newyorkensis 2681]|uniref:Peptidoglycan L-alanyl-D-glutamate endopeptidase CwlK n=1 Tax=Sporosarcina newyorkensis 2681 TaxID=1027292 RepID=F9DX03_9BACL|nr:M15 family metallopeptidase [Sporosarcina newyorkensis]EGQ21297.1 peptidoglycan L-alanyl-D-glutamate endopeptidase CwlK [Sporosarcina newyorkensis 2681]
MSVTTTCRDVSELSPVAQTAIRLLFQELYKAGIRDVFVTETYRSQARQKYLYAQGRTRPGNIVTWTLNSNHASRLAWDIAVAPPKSLYDVATLNKAGAIARKLGITWGGDWKNNLDRPHFEVKPGWKIPKGYKLEGQVTIPSNSKLRVQLAADDKKEMSDLQFTSGTLKNAYDTFINSKAQREIVVKTAIDAGYSEKWAKDLAEGKIEPGDLLMLGIGALIKQNK